MFFSIFTIFVFINSASFASNLTELEKQLETLREVYVIPGISAAIYRDGELVEHAVSGIRKVGSPELISREDKFHLGSCTKSMTATVAATFVEEGKLGWKSKLRDLLPEIEIHPDLKDVSYEMLLAHGSGLAKDPDDETYLELEKLETLDGREKLTALYLGKAPKFKVGTFNYSNIAYIIAGHILEKISGKSWEMLLQERLFIPLGMQSCGFGPTSDLTEAIPTQPWGHILREWSIKPVHDDNAAFYGPSANVHCSTSDWVKYLDIHLRGFNGQAKLLSEESFKQLHKIWPDNNSNQYTFGGWYRLNRSWAKGDVLTHSGTNTYNYASVWMDPKSNVILVSNTNRSKFSGVWASSDAISTLIRLFIKN